MADLPSSITASCLHTPEMIRAELAAMLGRHPAVTPRSLARLWLAGSPFVMGGRVTARDEAQAQEILGKRIPAAAIVREVEAALRALETIVPNANAGVKLTTDGADDLGPEWLADLYASVSRAAPGIPWREFLDMPLAAATHLAAAAHRANGGRTERPMDWDAALAQLSSVG